MDKQSRKVLVWLKCLVALVLVTGISTTSVAAVIYNVDRTVASGRITGTIETNGKTGVLTSADIIDWNLTVDTDGDPATFGQLLGPLSGNNSSFAVFGSALTATPTALFFDFSSPAFDILQIFATAPGVGWQLQALAPVFSDESIGDTFGQAFVTHPPIQQQIATAAATDKVVEMNMRFAGSIAADIEHLNLGLTVTSPLTHVQAKGSPGAAEIRGFGGSANFVGLVTNCFGSLGTRIDLTGGSLVFTFRDLSILFSTGGSGQICINQQTGITTFEGNGMFMGGRGRFEGATGQSVVRAEIGLGSNDGSFVVITGTIVGTIFLPDD